MHLLMDMDDVLIQSSYINEKGELNFFWTRNLEEDLGIKKDSLNVLFNEEWNDVIVGKKSIHKQVDEYLSAIDANVSKEDFISYWIQKDSKLNSEAVNFAKSMHNKGWKLYIGANQENVRVNSIVEKHNDFFSLFEKIYTSASLGVKKPDKKFFNMILSDLSLDASELVFIDDSSKNIKSALELGIKAFQYKKADIQVMNILKTITKDR